MRLTRRRMSTAQVPPVPPFAPAPPPPPAPTRPLHRPPHPGSRHPTSTPATLVRSEAARNGLACYRHHNTQRLRTSSGSVVSKRTPMSAHTSARTSAALPKGFPPGSGEEEAPSGSADRHPTSPPRLNATPPAPSPALQRGDAACARGGTCKAARDSRAVRHQLQMLQSAVSTPMATLVHSLYPCR